MQNKVSTFLWFESNANEAATLYCSIFPISKITSVTPTATSFEIEGQRFVAFNGGPHYKLTPAISLYVSCNTQDEVDALWTRFLAEGGRESKCGWLVDRYGLSWQIVPTIAIELLNDPDPVKVKRVVDALLAMQKLDIATLQRAYRGE